MEERALDGKTAHEIMQYPGYANAKRFVHEVQAVHKSNPGWTIKQAAESLGKTDKAYYMAKYRVDHPIKTYNATLGAQRARVRNARAARKKNQLVQLEVPHTPAAAEPVADDQEMEVLIVKGKPADIAKILSGRYGK